MRPRSIRGRMVLIAALAILASLLIAGWALAGALEGFVTRGLDQRLDSQITLLASAVDERGAVDRARIARVRGMLEGEPGWRWRISGPDGTLGSADFPPLATLHPPGPPPAGEAGPAAPPPGPLPPDAAPDRPSPAEGRTEQGVRVHARQVRLPSPRGPVTISAAAPRAVVARPIRAALLPLLAMLAGLGILLAVASLVQLRLALRPLRRLRDDVAAIRAGERARVGEDQPAELQSLATELNALAADSERALATARTSAANLAHALKTPVATLALDLAGDAARAAQVARIDETIRHHLARARVQASATRATTTLAPALDDLATAIGRLHADRGLTLSVQVPGDLAVALDAQDLDEVAGNLVDNAARHARSTVTVTAAAEGRQIRLTVIDDGPGIPETDRLRATQAGARLDERGDGHGFGLAIARELAELHGGRLILDEAPGGGLSATVLLPRAAETD
ncbi:sensor histidine kinase [Sphingomonas pseudosanguinis]|uniref:histidine kinase n=1 Tax=Sphingomonas pseudosanguinis TaxID=413712 RepID=A0A7W6ACK9_9SPHN|nr:HAMP domain-containing sensor histidine kinase [Sphingomonas pseudosanguinis]MBB3880852.1 signal transduction histidine kinase [Sphingomonas pseudosanguinis]MBN3535915.1 HAMP domain-containing histidine kinase [Sphingomonas pseudosanguinis]